jgi:hypothetical protein
MMNEVLLQKGWFEHRSKPCVWLDIPTCEKIVRIVLVRALKSQLSSALEALDALKIVPEVKDPLVTPSQSEKEGEDSPTQSKKKKEKTSSDIIKEIPRAEASHINLFMWLRIMLQQLQGEQIHRTAAIRLMFESAAAGALTYQSYTPGDPASKEGGGKREIESGQLPLHVEYPQFQAISRFVFMYIYLYTYIYMYEYMYVCIYDDVYVYVYIYIYIYIYKYIQVYMFMYIYLYISNYKYRTLFPTISMIEIASLFSLCYEEGQTRVTADVFIHVADLTGLFARYICI